MPHDENFIFGTPETAFNAYRDTGKPPVRALVMDFTDDPEICNIGSEYIFCEDVPSGRFTVRTKGIPVYRKK